MESNNNSDVTSNYNFTSYDFPCNTEPDIPYVITYVIISFGLPLTLAAIYSLYSQVQNSNVAPIFIINLLISDLIQLCCMIVVVAQTKGWANNKIILNIYRFGVMANVGFMVCVALERYLIIAWPLWYRFRRTIKSSLVVCVVVWTLPLVHVLVLHFSHDYGVKHIISTVVLLVPFPLLIFFLCGTLKSLCAAISVSSNEKRRIVGMLVLVVLIYTLVFLPAILMFLRSTDIGTYFICLAFTYLQFSPLADLILYFFMRKGVIDKLLASLCCCRMDSDDNSRSSS